MFIIIIFIEIPILSFLEIIILYNNGLYFVRRLKPIIFLTQYIVVCNTYLVHVLVPKIYLDITNKLYILWHLLSLLDVSVFTFF